MHDALEVRGLEASNGKLFIEVRGERQSAVLPQSDFTLSNKHLDVTLRDFGVLVFDKAAKQNLINLVKSVTSFAPTDVIEAPGWNKGYFVLGSGTVIHLPPDRDVVLAFVPDRSRFSQSSNLGKWRRHVAGPLNGQSVPIVMAMAALTAPLLQFMPHAENIALEIIGDHGTGKTTAGGVATSTIGGNGLASSTPYAISLKSLMLDPAANVRMYRDQPMIIEMVDAYTGLAMPKDLQRAYSWFANDLSPLSRVGPVDSIRTVAILTARDSLRSLAGNTAGAGTDGLITLRLAPQRAYGVFDALPTAHASGSAFANALAMDAADHHGTAFPALVNKLAALSGEKRAKVPNLLAGWQAEFLELVAASEGHNTANRTSRSLAAIYAAGRYAQRRGILPREWDCLEAAFQCYQLQQGFSPLAKPFGDRLEELIAQGAFVSVSRNSDRTVQAQLAKAAPGTLWLQPDHREVRVTRTKISELFPDWRLIEKSHDVAALLMPGDTDHRQRNAALAPGMLPQRLFCFQLPLLAGDDLPSIFKSFSNGEAH